MIENYLEKIKQRLKVVVLHAVIYTRYSSDNQRSESIDAQIRLIRKWAQEYNIIIDKVYADEAQSAKRDDRQQFQQMIADSKKQKGWQLVLVHKLDRFARNRMDSVAYRVELRKNKKYLISTTEQFDDTPESCLLEGIIESMAEFYSKNLARETMKGLTENALKAKHCGGTPPLGYELDALNFYKINEFEAQGVKLIYQWFLEGKSYTDIIAGINSLGYRTKRKRMFTRNSLYEILRNEKYTGTFVYNKMESRDEFTGARSRHKYKPESEIIKVENMIPEIISKEDWNTVQIILNSRKNAHTNRAKEEYLLSGKVQCGECGGSYVGKRTTNSRGNVYLSYICCRKRNSNYKCKNHCVNRDWLEEYVLKIVDNYISHLSHKQQHCIYKLCLERVENSHQSEIEVLKKEVRNIDKELFRIADVITIASSSTLIEKLTSLEQQKAEIQLQIENLAKEKRKSLSEQEIGLFLINFRKMLKERSAPYLKELVYLIVNKIIVNQENVIVYLNVPNVKVNK